jgi:undecaprenyl-diphosphatase
MPPTNAARRRIATWCVGGYFLTLGVGIAFALALAQAGNWLDGFAWEHDLLSAINALHLSPALDWMLLVLPWFGTSITLIPIIATAAIMLVRRGRSMLAVHLVVVQIGAFTMNPLLKAFFDRPRPGLWEMRGQFAWASYPSGHAIASVAVLFTMAVLLHRERGWHWPFGVATVLLVLTAYSRLYLGVHWPTDVIGGVMMGVVWLIVTLIAFRPEASAPVRELDGP